jgi:hypothetical protein
MAPKVVVITRENISRNENGSFLSDDKRFILFTFLYSIVSNTYNNIRVKKINSNQITYDEMKECYDDIKNNLSNNDNDLIYFIDEKSIFTITNDYISSFQSDISSVISGNSIDLMYLASSMDNCNSVEKIYKNEYPIIYYKSKTPKGLYGVVTTFGKWLHIFNKMKIRNEEYACTRLSLLVNLKEINAGTTWPRVVVPNMFMFENDNIENLYLNPCRLEEDYSKTYSKKESLSFYWFSLGIILFLLYIWLKDKITKTK